MQHGIAELKRLHLTRRIPYTEICISPRKDRPFLRKTIELGWVAAGDADEVLEVDSTFEDSFEEEREAGFETREAVWNLFEEGFAVD